jgi:Tfp pilus assembly protein PilE
MKLRNVSVVIVMALGALLSAGCKSAADQYQCRARQAEATANLKALHAAQAAYVASHAKYASSLAELAFTPVNDRYYDITIDSATAATFKATANGKARAAGAYGPSTRRGHRP